MSKPLLIARTVGALLLSLTPLIADNNTQVSPGIGALPNQFSAMGGIVIDMVGANGKRLTAQVSPTSLVKGYANPSSPFLAVWTQTGFDSYTLQSLLGGGLQKVNLRITLQNGESGSPNPVYEQIFGANTMPYSGPGILCPGCLPGPAGDTYAVTQPPGWDFDAGTNLYIAIPLAGGGYVNCGYMGQATTYQLDANGNSIQTYTGFPGTYAIDDYGTFPASKYPRDGYSQFPVTGWFTVPSNQLVGLYNSLAASGSMTLGMWAIDPGNVYYDFTQGVANTIVNIPLIPPSIISFTASPSTVVGSGTVTLAWQTAATTSVAIDQGVTVNPAQVNGSVQVPVSAPTKFTLTATSPQGSITATATVTILPPLNITTPSLPAALAGSLYSQALAASGGTSPYQWSIASGSLPAGLALNASGTLSGTPTAAATATFVVQVTDATVPTQVTTAAYTLTVNPGLTITTASLPNPVAAAPYTQTLTATGGTAPYTWSVTSGSLPTGLALAPNGTISGAATKSGPFTFTVRATDSTSPTAQLASQSYTVTAGAQLTIQTNSLPTGVVGAAYNQGLVAAGGTMPYTWSLDSGPLPAGLSLSANGSITGTPTTPGVTSFTVRITDSTTPSAETTTQSLTIYIAGPITIDTVSLPDGTAGQPYAQPLAAHNGIQPYVWTLKTGSLPPGMALLTTGALIGTPNVTGAYTFTLKASDSSIPVSQSTTQSYTVHINPGFSITTGALPGGSTGLTYSAALQAADGIPPISYAVVFGLLPPGLVLSNDGHITGTPTAPGIFNMLIRATDSSSPAALSADQPLTLTIDSTLSITTASLPQATDGTQYVLALTAVNGLQPYAWAVAAGKLPDGLSLLPSGTIVGTPIKPGVFNVTIQAIDSSQPSAATSTRAYALTVTTPLTLTTQSLPAAFIGAPYAAVFTTTGGLPPYTYSLSNGSLPAGVSLNPIGVILGTPTATGLFNITVQVSDSSVTPATVTETYTISVNQPLTVTSPTTLPPGTLNSIYSDQLTAAGGVAPYTWSALSAVPAGLQLLPSGVVIGVPTQAGAYPLNLHVLDSSSPTPQTATLTTNITITPPLVITNTPFPNPLPSVAYAASAQATGGVPPYAWSLSSGSLPAGLTLSSNGLLAGVTTATAAAYTIQLTATDADVPTNTATQEFVFLVSAPFAITATSPLQTALIGKPYTQALSITGGQASFTWTVVGGALAPGLTLASDGTLSGTPTTAGPSNFVAECKDSANETTIKALTLSVEPPLGIVSAALPAVATNTVYLHLFQASAGTPPFHWTLTSGTLPQGLTLTNSGVLTGTATTTGTSPITITVADSTSPTPQTASANLTLTVSEQLIAVTQTWTAISASPFSQNVAATGGTPPYTWTVASGSLPQGLTLTGSTLSGTPTTFGQYAVVLNVADSAGLTASALFGISVIQQLSIPLPASSIPTATNGLSYAAVLSAFGGTPPYTWGITAGSLPPGITLSSTGILSGLPMATGSYSFTAAVTDSASQTANKQYTIQVQAAPPSLTIPPSTAALPPAVVGLTYAATLTVSGGTGPYTWSLVPGTSLPAGFSLNGPALVGTPTTPGTYSFQLTVKDATGLSTTSIYVLTVGAGLTITTNVIPPAVVGTPYAAAVAAIGGTPPYTWSGTLPSGLRFTSPGIITGTPTATASPTLTLTVTDSSKPSLTASKTFNMTLESPLVIATTNTPTLTTTTAANISLRAQGGTTPYTWSLTGGILPPGLTFAPTGTVTGTPTATGTYSATITVSDSSTAQLSTTAQIVLYVITPLAVTTTALPNATTGVQYTQTLQAQGGMPPYSWSIASGSLPQTLGLTGPTLTGTSSTPATATFTVKVTDSTGRSATQPLKLAVVGTLTATTTSLPPATVNAAFTYTLQASGGTTPYNWTLLSGSLPAGLRLATTGTLSGTPSAVGSSSIVAQVVDSGTPPQSSTTTLTVTVASGLTITTTTLPQATVALLYRVALTATGGAPPYTWRASSGPLPPGLVLTSTGVLTGTPVNPGTTSLTILVADSQNQTATSTFTLNTAAAPVVTLLISPATPNVNPLAQEPVQVSLASPYPTDLTGQLTLTGTQDPDALLIQNSHSLLTLPFTVAAGTTAAVFSGGPVTLQSGTSDQPFTVTAQTTTPAATGSQQISVPPLAPHITNGTYTASTGSFTITLQGFSTTREVTQATFTFSTSTSASAPFTMPVANLFKAWYQSATSNGSGTFKYEQPFTLVGNLAAVTAVQVTLTNSVGTSTPVTISMGAQQ